MSKPIEACGVGSGNVPKLPDDDRDHPRLSFSSSAQLPAGKVVGVHLPTEAQERKNVPLDRGLFRYFPDALCAVAALSKIGNDQHNPGQPLHWAKEKSTDHGDCLLRHQMDVGTVDTDRVRHATKVAWRALAQLQIEIENETIFDPKPFA